MEERLICCTLEMAGEYIPNIMEQYLEIYGDKYGVWLPRPMVTVKQLPRQYQFGTAEAKQSIIALDLDSVLYNGIYYLDDAIPHFLAHLFVENNYRFNIFNSKMGAPKAHSQEWKNMMRLLGCRPLNVTMCGFHKKTVSDSIYKKQLTPLF